MAVSSELTLLLLLICIFSSSVHSIRRMPLLGDEGDLKSVEANERRLYERGDTSDKDSGGTYGDGNDSSYQINNEHGRDAEIDRRRRRRLSSPPSYESYEVTSLSGLDPADFPTKHYAGHIPAKVGEFSESYGNQIFSWLFHPAAPDGAPITGASEPGLTGKKVREGCEEEEEE